MPHLVGHNSPALRLFPALGPVKVAVTPLRRHGDRVVVRVNGSSENGWPEVLRVDPTALIGRPEQLQLTGRLMERCQQPGRYYGFQYFGRVSVAGCKRNIAVPVASLATGTAIVDPRFWPRIHSSLAFFLKHDA